MGKIGAEVTLHQGAHEIDRLLAVIAPDQTRPSRQPRGTVISRVYDAYQKGRYAYFRYEPQAFVEALTHFAKAAELDTAEDLAREAIRRDDRAALGYARLGWLLGYLGWPQETIAAFDAAVARDPESPEAYLAYGETMNRLARPQDAGPLLETLFSKDSFLPPSWEFPQGHRHLLLGEQEVAIGHFQFVLDRVPRFVPAQIQMVRAHWEAGDTESAKQAVSRIKEIAPKFSLAHAKRMFPYPFQKKADALTAALSCAGLR